MCALSEAAPPALSPFREKTQEVRVKHAMLKVRLITAIAAESGVKRARSPAGSVQCKQGSLSEGKNVRKKSKTRDKRGDGERAPAQTASAGGHAVLRIRPSMNLINIASLISGENVPPKASRSAPHLLL